MSASPEAGARPEATSSPTSGSSEKSTSLTVKAYQRWCDFWFEPQETSTLALIRIAFGLVTLAWSLSLLPDLRTFFSSEGLLAHPLDLSVGGLWEPFGLSSSYGLVELAFVAMVIASVCLILGVGTRAACFVLWLCMLGFGRRNPYVFDSGDPYLRIVAFYLFLTPAGASLSLPRWLNERERFWEFPKRSVWGLRLIQLQVSVLYITAVYDKVSLGTTTWDNGTALSYVLRLKQLERFPSFILFPTNSLPINLMTYGTLAIELSLGVLIWNRRLRPWVMLLGVFLHLGIEYSIRVGFFSMIAIIAIGSFLAPEMASKAILSTRDWVQARRRGRLRPQLEQGSA